MSHAYLGHNIKKFLTIYLKFKFEWRACVLAGNPTQAKLNIELEAEVKLYQQRFH